MVWSNILTFIFLCSSPYMHYCIQSLKWSVRILSLMFFPAPLACNIVCNGPIEFSLYYPFKPDQSAFEELETYDRCGQDSNEAGGLRGKFLVMSRFWQQVPQLIGTDPNTVETSRLVTHLSTSAPLRRGNKSNRYRELLFGSLCMNGLKTTVDNIFLPSPRTDWIS